MMISTGFTEIDTTLGGGYPTGKVTLVVGGLKSGKTTMLMDAVVRAQTQGHLVGVVSPYDSVPPGPAKYLNTNRILYMRPNSIEEASNLAVQACASCPVVVIDDIVRLDSESDRIVAAVRALASLMRAVRAAAVKYDTTVLMSGTHGTHGTPLQLLAADVILRLEGNTVSVAKSGVCQHGC